MSPRFLLVSPPVWVALILTIRWALTRKTEPGPLAELLEGDVS